MQIMAQGIFMHEVSRQIVIITPCSLVLPSKLKEHTQNNDHKDITPIIIISDFLGFLHILCKLCINWANMNKLQDN